MRPQALRSGFGPSHTKSAAEQQMERLLVVDQLRAAKEEVEAERQRILGMFGRAMGSGKWQ